MIKNADSNAYTGSAYDLATVRDINNSLKVLKGINRFCCLDEVDQEIEIAENRLEEIVGIVDEFYALLGSRNWVFSDALNLERMKIVVKQENPEEAENEIVNYLNEDGVLQIAVRKLNRFVDMRPRLYLLEKAITDFHEERYYSVVLVLISVMDGFVNDLDKAARKGLHARKADEMHLDDCVATMWQGLPSIQRKFTMSVRRRNDEPIYDVHRNGIMHGMETNYDNAIIAAKAWLMLFGIADWADKKINNENSESRHKELLTLPEALKKFEEIKEKEKIAEEYLANWNNHQVDLRNSDSRDKELLEACNQFLEAWRSENYGKLAQYCAEYCGKSNRKKAGEVSKEYSKFPIAKFQINSIERVAPAVAYLSATLSNDKREWSVRLRLVRMDEDGLAAADYLAGKWKVMRYLKDPFPKD